MKKWMAGYLAVMFGLGSAMPSKASAQDLYQSIKGEYQGLIYSEIPASAGTNSSYFSFKVTDDGSMKGKFYVGGRAYAVDQSVNQQGWADVVLMRGDVWEDDLELVGSVRLLFEVLGPVGKVYAEVAEFAMPGTGWSFTMEGFRAPFDTRTNPSPQAGRYTAVLPGDGTVPEFNGSGFVTLTVDRNGRVSATGSLPDGQYFSQRTRVGAEGQWPCYVSLNQAYRKTGSLVGWLRFSAAHPDSPSGSVIWKRPATVSYPQGTAQILTVSGSSYVQEPGKRILDFAQGVIILSGPGLDVPLTNTFRLSEKNKVTAQGDNHLRLTFNQRTGSFSGSIMDPVSRTRLPFKGAVLQRLNSGAGWYLLPNKCTGAVWLGAAVDE